MREKIEKLLAPLDALDLECDGFVRAANWLLHREGIEHEVWSGEVEFGNGNMPFHFWIKVGKDFIVDYRLRMWFGPSAPHGVLDRPVENVRYKGGPLHGFTPNPAIYELLTGRNAYDDEAKETTT